MRRKSPLLRLDATGFVDLLQMSEDGLDVLTKHALHEALAAGKQLLQESDVSPMGRQQQSHIREVLDRGEWERWKGRGGGITG